MIPPPPLTKNQPPGSGSVGLASPNALKKEPEIVVIPEKFYGLALKMKAETPPPAPPPPKPQPVRPPTAVVKPIWPWIVLSVVVLFAISGGFIYFNRDLLFKPPAPPIVVAPPPQSPPSAPVNLTANVASGTTAVALSWVDTSGNETGYRLERKRGQESYLTLTNLSVNAVTFLDVTVANDQTYDYRVIAVGAGGDSSPSNEATVTVGPAIAPAPPIPTLPPSGLDSDSDGLTDREEPLYGTDPQKQDSDGDGFLDGNEVFHLYNPAATAPVRLLDSGLVKPLQSAKGWSIYVLERWTSTLTADGATGTIRTGQGETFIVRVEETPEGSKETALSEIKTKGGLLGRFDQEKLRAVFDWDGKVVSFTYDIDGQPFINYRTTYEMMLNSLKLENP